MARVVWVRTPVLLVVALLLAGCMAEDPVAPPPPQPTQPAAPAEPAPTEPTVAEADEAPEALKTYREGVLEVEVLEVHPDNVPPQEHEQYGVWSSSSALGVGNLLRLRLLDGDVPVNATWDLDDGTRIEGAQAVEHRFMQEGVYWVNATGADTQVEEPLHAVRSEFLSGSLPPCPTCEVSDVAGLAHPSPPSRHAIHLSNTTGMITVLAYANLAVPSFVLYDAAGNERARPYQPVDFTPLVASTHFIPVEAGEARVWHLDVWARVGVPGASFGARIDLY